eukprot:5979773-Prymnesium_polylepis.3
MFDAAPSSRPRHPLRLALALSLLAVLLLEALQPSPPPPDLLQPACEAHVSEPLVRGLVEGQLGGYPDGRMPLADIPIAALNTTPLMQGMLGPPGCMSACLNARLHWQHCVVQRVFRVVDAALVGLDHVELQTLNIRSSCEWWQVVGDDDVGVN